MPVVFAFVVIPVLLAITLVWGVVFAWRRAGAPRYAARHAGLVTGLAAAAWMAITWAAADSGLLRQWDRNPPPFMFLIVSILVVSAAIAYSTIGGHLARHVPLWALVAVQSFRLPLELAMHGLYERGVMPVQMSYSGRNFDIVTGATAVIVALLAGLGHGGPRLVAAWNVIGVLLLVNVVTVAILSTPRLRLFGDDHVVTFVTYPPFVWLPAVMVVAALAGHLVIFRALRRL